MPQPSRGVLDANVWRGGVDGAHLGSGGNVFGKKGSQSTGARHERRKVHIGMGTGGRAVHQAGLRGQSGLGDKGGLGKAREPAGSRVHVVI